jgi:hypothetical protein
MTPQDWFLLGVSTKGPGWTELPAAGSTEHYENNFRRFLGTMLIRKLDTSYRQWVRTFHQRTKFVPGSSNVDETYAKQIIYESTSQRRSDAIMTLRRYSTPELLKWLSSEARLLVDIDRMKHVPEDEAETKCDSLFLLRLADNPPAG